MNELNPFFKLNSFISEIKKSPDYQKEHPDEIKQKMKELSKEILVQLKNDPDHINLADAYEFKLNAKDYSQYSEKRISKISDQILHSSINEKLEIIETIPQEHQQKFLQLVTLLSSNEEISSSTLEILLEAISKDQMGLLIEALIELKSAQPKIDTWDMRDISKAIVSLPEAQRNDFLKVAKGHSLYEIEKLAETFRKIPVNQTGNFSDFLLKSDKRIDINDAINVSEIFLKLPQDYLENPPKLGQFLDHLMELKSAQPKIDTWEMRDISKAIVSLPEAQRKDFLKVAKGIDPYDIRKLAETFRKIPVNQTGNFSDFLLKLDKGMDIKDAINVSEIFLKLPQDYLENPPKMGQFLDHLLQLKTAHPWINSYDIPDLSKALLSIPEPQRGYFNELAQVLAAPQNKSLKYSDIEDLASIFQQIPSELVKNFTQYLQSFKSEKGVDLEVIQSFSQAFLKFPKNHMDILLKTLNRLEIGMISKNEITSIFNSLPKINMEIDSIFRFQNLTLRDFVKIALAVTEIPENFPEFLNKSSEESNKLIIIICNEAKKLFTERMTTEDRLAIVKNLIFAQLLNNCGVDLSKKSRLSSLSKIIEKNVDHADVIKTAQEFITKDMNLFDIEDVFNTLAELPDHSRKTTLDQCKKIFDPHMTWHEKESIIFILKEMSPKDQEKIIQEFKNQVPETLNSTQKIAIFLCLASASPEGSFEKTIEKIKQPPPIEEVMVEEEFEFPFVDVPKDSDFANTDLVILKDDFKSESLNGIKASEFHQMEAIFKRIKSNQTGIKISHHDDHFPFQIEEAIKLLLTRKVGRNLITQILNHPKFSSLPIEEGDKTRLITGAGIAGIDVNLESRAISRKLEHLPSGEIQMRRKKDPLALSLGHEMIHFLHFLNQELADEAEPNLHKDYDNLEEQITITGFKKEIHLPESLLQEPSSLSGSKNPEWRKPLEEWEEEPGEGVFNKESFDPLNERNLTAAFTDSKHVYHPRFGHHAERVEFVGGKEAVKAELDMQFQRLPLSQEERKMLLNLFPK